MTVTGMVTTIFSYSDTDSGRDEASFWRCHFGSITPDTSRSGPGAGGKKSVVLLELS